MAESIHSGINDSLNKLDLNTTVEKFHESDFDKKLEKVVLGYLKKIKNEIIVN